MFKFIIYSVIALSSINSVFSADIIPPCGLDYGSSANETKISQQMRYGTVASTVEAINQAKNTRKTSLGCPQLALSYSPSNTSEPSLSSILNLWDSIYIPTLSSYQINCPRIGRYENNSALGAYYAMQSGYYSNSTKLEEITDMMYDQQYASWNISSPVVRNKGVFAYIHTPSSDSCYIGGVVGKSVTALCDALPEYCVTYTGGQSLIQKGSAPFIM